MDGSQCLNIATDVTSVCAVWTFSALLSQQSPNHVYMGCGDVIISTISMVSALGRRVVGTQNIVVT